MTLYTSTGKLTGDLLPENLPAAQAYLSSDDMTAYIDESLEGVILHVYWTLNGTSAYTVTAVASRDLTEDELRVLSEWTSGQNSDGLGEGFEQQDFAWLEDEDDQTDCHNCDGAGTVVNNVIDGVEEYEDCATCDGAGYFEHEDGRMCSFDWESNKSIFTKVS